MILAAIICNTCSQLIISKCSTCSSSSYDNMNWRFHFTLAKNLVKMLFNYPVGSCHYFFFISRTSADLRSKRFISVRYPSTRFAFQKLSDVNTVARDNSATCIARQLENLSKYGKPLFFMDRDHFCLETEVPQARTFFKSL